jgi:hypothetical protein
MFVQEEPLTIKLFFRSLHRTFVNKDSKDLFNANL